LAVPHAVEVPFAYPVHFVGSAAPLHVRAAQIASPAPPGSHFAREPWGAPLTGEHVPTLPATSHAWH
jgi:hypothetical protein